MTVVDVTEQHKDLVDELLAAVSESNPDADLELLARAFAYAARAHEGQLRRSGEEFIRHPWSVAKLCAELRLPPKWRGRIAVIVGVLAIAVAVGFAPHLAKGGPLPVRARPPRPRSRPTPSA